MNLVHQDRKSLAGQRAFTLMETAVAASVILIFSLGALVAMTTMNRQANIARCQTLALAFAQQKLDDIMTVPWQLNTGRPALLAAGSVTENNLGLGNDNLNNQAGLSSQFTTLDLPVTASRTTTIADLTNRLLKATVLVTFNYRGKDYTVRLSSIRATDNF